MRLLDGLPPAFHVLWPPVAALAVTAAVVTALLLLVRLMRRRSKVVTARGATSDGFPETVAVRARPLMSESEIALLNLLSLVAHDHFLLLAKMPLRSLLQFHAQTADDARAAAIAIRGVTVDFVMIHPGTRRPVKAVFVERRGEASSPVGSVASPPVGSVASSPSGSESSSPSAPAPWVDALLRDAEIDVIRLDRDARYSVEELTDALGLAEEE